MIKKHPITLECQKALYADSNRIFITICYRRASRPTAIFYLFYYPTNLIDLQIKHLYRQIYQSGEENISTNVLFKDEIFWMTQKDMATLFRVDVSTINYHLKETFDSEELSEESTIGKFPIVRLDGTRKVTRTITFYNLDAIIAVGYRVNSKEATQFRIWATKVLREYIVKGFAINDDMLKNGTPFGQNYFKELLRRVQSIRSSERQIYQQTQVYL